MVGYVWWGVVKEKQGGGLEGEVLLLSEVSDRVG